MSMKLKPLFLLTLMFFTSTSPQAVAREALAPYKDRLYSYASVLKSKHGGAWRAIDYQELRDINGRDDVPERRVKGAYIDMAARRATKARKTPSGVNYYVTGREKGASIITMFIHGAGGNGKLGINDVTFGGNFNRIKMLMLKNGGLYVSPDAGRFGDSSAREISTLLTSLAAASPGAPIILACGSGGGDICHRLAQDGAVAEMLDGMLFLGSYRDPSYLRSAAVKQKVPVVIGHGSRDTVFAVETMDAFYEELRGAGVPTMFVRFETGTHGTPIRMIDWRESINWILQN